MDFIETIFSALKTNCRISNSSQPTTLTKRSKGVQLA